MPATTGAMELAGWHLALWAVVIVVAAAMTTLTVIKAMGPAAGSEPDAAFWNTFTGLMVIVPALVIPALSSPTAGLLLLALAIGTSGTVFKGHRRFERLRRQSSSGRPDFAAISEQHDHLLARWRGYELDPAAMIDYPGMTDIRVPDTAALIRSLKHAEQCRVTPGTDYRSAVEELDQALARAERAAGVPSVNGVPRQ